MLQGRQFLTIMKFELSEVIVIEVTLIQNALNGTTSFYQYLLYICHIKTSLVDIVHCCYIAEKAYKLSSS